MTNKYTVWMVILFVGIIALTSLGGAIWLIAVDRTVPDQLWGAGTTAIGLLGGMLVSTRVGEPLPPPPPPEA